jgi:hypothetical protein
MQSRDARPAFAIILRRVPEPTSQAHLPRAVLNLRHKGAIGFGPTGLIFSRSLLQETHFADETKDILVVSECCGLMAQRK